MRDPVLAAVIMFLMLNLAGGALRVQRGPTQADRMLATLLFGSTTVAVLLLLAQWTGQPALYDVALLLVLLAVVLSVAFIGLPKSADRENE